MQGNPTKSCFICRQTFPLDNFYSTVKRNGRRYWDSYCKPCACKKRSSYPPGKLLDRPAWIRKKNLALYGLTIEMFDSMVDSQGGVCAICNRPETHINPRTKKLRRLNVDHDHATGKVRGLLCSKCNRGIGQLGDSIELMKAALAYLEYHAGSVVPFDNTQQERRSFSTKL